MSLANQMGALTTLSILNAVDAVNTAAATSAKVAVSGYEGQVAVVVDTGVVDAGSITYTFLTDSDGAGAGEVAVVPVGGALTVVTTSNDPLTQIAVFNVSQLKGYLQVVGTIASGGVLVSYTLVGRKKTV